MSDESAGRTVYYIMKEAVSQERLADLSIRVFAEENLPLDDGSDASVPCWVITKTGLRKLYRYGYVEIHVVDTQFEGVKFVALANPDGSPARVGIDPQEIHTAEIRTWDGSVEYKAVVKDIVTKKLIPYLDRDVQIHVPHGRPHRAVTDDGPFHIFVWSAPDHGSYTPPSVVWGMPMPCGDHGSFNMWYSGMPITTSEGDEVGAFDKNNLFIYFDLFHSKKDDVIPIFEKILEQVVECAKNGFDITEACRERVKERYIASCLRRADARRKELKATLDHSRSKADSLQQQLKALIVDYRQAVVEHENFSKYEESLKDSLAKEFESLVSTPKVVNIDWRGESLTVDISNIQVTDPRSKKLHDIGEFKIIVDMGHVRVLFINKTRKVNGYSEGMEAPHVFPGGRPCLGTMETVIPKLIANYEWCALIQMCITFLESVNVRDSAGRHIDKWPLVESTVEKEPDEDEERKEAVSEVTSTEAAAAPAAEAATAEDVGEPDVEAATDEEGAAERPADEAATYIHEER